MNKNTIIETIIKRGFEPSEILDELIQLMDNFEATTLLEEVANNLGVYDIDDNEPLLEIEDWDTNEYDDDYFD
jgi:hypothetical protein